MDEKEKIRQYLNSKGISKNSFYQKTGFAIGFLDSGKSLGADKLETIIDNYPDLSLEWLVLGKGDMINNVDNRQYYSDSPDVLKAQIEILDERIKEKDAQIKEKDAQINKLLSILSQK